MRNAIHTRDFLKVFGEFILKTSGRVIEETIISDDSRKFPEISQQPRLNSSPFLKSKVAVEVK